MMTRAHQYFQAGGFAGGPQADFSNMSYKLSRLIKGYPLVQMIGTLEREITAIAYDSRKVEPGNLFVAMPGAHHDGGEFIGEAIRRGASAYITESSVDQLMTYGVGGQDVTAVHVDDSRHALAWVAAQFYNHPSRQMDLVGITGTNGKTTLTFLLESIFRAAGHASGIIGSINYRYAGQVRPSPMTTPEALEINQMLADMVRDGVRYCFMEVSSHSLALKRVRELRFAVGVFTNLTRDHLDYHKTMDHYIHSKKGLFRDCATEKLAINIDDPVGREIIAECPNPALTTGLETNADVTAEDCTLSKAGISLLLKTPFGNQAIQSPLLGKHNVYNLLSASAVALLLDIPLDVIAEGIRSLRRVPGRFDTVQCGQDFVVAVDYAHTDDALLNVLRAARGLTRNRLIVVFGCGGDRDPGKRPEMGRIATELSDFAVITSDNPRTEDPDSIIGDILKGIPPHCEAGKRYTILPNRREAIRFAIQQAQAGDLVLIAGKGHEDYQILKTGTIRFDDREEAEEALRSRLDTHG